MVYKEFLEKLSGKKVLLIGPSSNVKKDLENIKGIKMDVVIMLNNHYSKMNLNYKPNFIFHHLNVNSYKLSDIKYWIENKVKILPRFNIEDDRNSNKFKYLKKIGNYEDIIINFDYSIYMEYRDFYKSSPNTGTLAMHHLLSSDLEKLYVVGIDFYDTFYSYNNNPNLAKSARDNSHNPKHQIEVFRELFKYEKRLITFGDFNKKMK